MISVLISIALLILFGVAVEVWWKRNRTKCPRCDCPLTRDDTVYRYTILWKCHDCGWLREEYKGKQ